MTKRPTQEQIVEAVVAVGATAEQGAAAATVITNMLSTSPDANAYATEFNNKILQKWNDTHSDATIYDRFRTSTSAPTVQAVVYEKLSPVNFSWSINVEDLANDEKCQTKKVPAIHSVLKSLNVQDRFKTTSSKNEIDKIANGQAISVENVIANLGASYSDDRTVKFIGIVNGIESAKVGDEINTMATLSDVSTFIQRVKYYTFKFKEKRTSDYNAYVNANDAKSKADTKMYPNVRPVCLIDPKKLYQIEGDYYATLFQLQQALPDVDFVEVDGMTGNRFAILIDPRVICWDTLYFEIKSEQMCGRPDGDLQHYLFAEEIMGSFNCFNRMVFKTSAARTK